MKPIDGEVLLKFLRQVNFTGKSSQTFLKVDPSGLYLLQHTVLVYTITCTIKLSNGIDVWMFIFGDMDRLTSVNGEV